MIGIDFPSFSLPFGLLLGSFSLSLHPSHGKAVGVNVFCRRLVHLAFMYLLFCLFLTLSLSLLAGHAELCIRRFEMASSAVAEDVFVRRTLHFCGGPSNQQPYLHSKTFHSSWKHLNDPQNAQQMTRLNNRYQQFLIIVF